MKREFIFTNKWLDLLFENRNRAYGAYILRKRQPDYIIAGYFTSITVMLALVFIVYKFNAVNLTTIREVIMDPIPVDKVFNIPELKRPPVKTESPNKDLPKSNPANQNLAPVVVEDRNNKERKDSISISFNTTGTTNHSDSSNAETNLPKVNANPTPIDPGYNRVEKLPEFPGGDEALFKFLQKNTHYPPLYRDEKITGTVYVSFVVDANGKVTDIKTVRNIDGYPDFSQAAIKAISKMPDWIPGRQNGINVPVIYRLPVKFSIR